MKTEETKPKNPPAFPNQNTMEKSGMTLRDYFANSAMEAIISNSNVSPTTNTIIAELCYNMADAMLKQREL